MNRLMSLVFVLEHHLISSKKNGIPGKTPALVMLEATD